MISWGSRGKGSKAKAAQNKKKKPDGRELRGFVFSTLSFLVICRALVLGMSVFFRGVKY